jgi:Na+/melibiose symporter-like transporter
MLVSFIGVTILLGTIILAWSYPLTREKYERIQKLLKQRREQKSGAE